ncbi:MAG: hypothetical protein Q9163_003407 [Psora crenata]
MLSQRKTRYGIKILSLREQPLNTEPFSHLWRSKPSLPQAFPSPTSLVPAILKGLGRAPLYSQSQSRYARSPSSGKGTYWLNNCVGHITGEHNPVVLYMSGDNMQAAFIPSLAGSGQSHQSLEIIIVVILATGHDAILTELAKYNLNQYVIIFICSKSSAPIAALRINAKATISTSRSPYSLGQKNTTGEINIRVSGIKEHLGIASFEEVDWSIRDKLSQIFAIPLVWHPNTLQLDLSTNHENLSFYRDCMTPEVSNLMLAAFGFTGMEDVVETFEAEYGMEFSDLATFFNMPGRRSTGAPSLHKPKPKPKTKRQKAQRSLNALAIAEKELPGRARVRRNRLGESEPRPSNRKRRRDDDDEAHEDGQAESGHEKRPRRRQAVVLGNEDGHVEMGSDSSGNEWTVGRVDEDEDSELDSDEAMDQSDEERFEGYAFRGGSSSGVDLKTRKKKVARMLEADELEDVDLDEGKEEDGTDGEIDGFGDEGVDLAMILDNEEEEKKSPPVRTKAEEPGSSDPGSDSHDNAEESIFEKEDSLLSISDNEDDTADASKLASLQALVSTMNSRHEGPTRSRDLDAHELMAPSEFGLNSRRKLTVADLVPTVTDPELKKSLRLLADDDSKSKGKHGGIPKKLDVPLPKRQQDRNDRAAAYEKSKETLSRWIDTVKHNRRAEHLSFPLQDPSAAAPPGERRMLPNTRSRPLTDLESTIQNILRDSGLDPQNGKSADDQIQAFEELKTNKLPIGEVLARRAELRRSRELLFREEIRAKRIKKIKSKAYRKIHRRERERNLSQLKNAMAADGDDESESEKERSDRKRAEERMGARHRESRWAKGVKDSGRAKWDDDAREAVNDMARRSEELRKRIEGKNVRVEEDNGLSSSSDDEDMDTDGDEQQRLQQQLDDLRDKSAIADGAKGSSLSNLSFMKKAEATRKAENDVEIESLRRHLAGEGTPSEDEGQEGSGRKSYGPQKKQSEASDAMRSAKKSEFEEREDSDAEDQTAGGRSDVDIDSVVIDAGYEGFAGNLVSSKDSGPKARVTEGPWNHTSSKESGAPLDHSQSQVETTITEDGRKPPLRSALKGARAADQAQQKVRPTEHEIAAENSYDEDEEDDSAQQHPITFRNGELAKRAFAGDEVVDKFLEEKEELVREQQPQVLDNTLPGWGTWTGAGLSKKAQKRNKKKFLTKVPGIAPQSRKDAKLKDVIISEKRVKKNAKYLAGQLPYPFETRAQYERSLRLPVGPEWTTKETFQGMTKPRVLMKQGIIAPMVKPMV